MKKFIIYNLKFIIAGLCAMPVGRQAGRAGLKFIIKGNRGQVALVVLIVSAVVLTLGLSVSKKTTVETRIDTDEELLKKAFNAAESGIEYYLGSNNTSYQNLDNQEKADVTVSDLKGTVLNFEKYTLVNQRALFWLVDHDANGAIGTVSYSSGPVDICVASGFAGALKVDYFYKEGINYKVDRHGYNIGAQTVTNFTPKSLDSDGCFEFTLKSNSLLVSVMPMFAGTQLSMEGGAEFPSQGEEITSVGRAGDVSSVGVNKKVTIVRSFGIPFFMMEAITAGNSVLSN